MEDGRQGGRAEATRNEILPSPSTTLPAVPGHSREGRIWEGKGRELEVSLWKEGKLASRSDAAVVCHASSRAPATRTSPDLD